MSTKRAPQGTTPTTAPTGPLDGRCVAILQLSGQRCNCVSFHSGAYLPEKCTECAHKLEQHPGATLSTPETVGARPIEKLASDGLVKNKQKVLTDYPAREVASRDGALSTNGRSAVVEASPAPNPLPAAPATSAVFAAPAAARAANLQIDPGSHSAASSLPRLSPADAELPRRPMSTSLLPSTSVPHVPQPETIERPGSAPLLRKKNPKTKARREYKLYWKLDAEPEKDLINFVLSLFNRNEEPKKTFSDHVQAFREETLILGGLLPAHVPIVELFAF